MKSSYKHLEIFTGVFYFRCSVIWTQLNKKHRHHLTFCGTIFLINITFAASCSSKWWRGKLWDRHCDAKSRSAYMRWKYIFNLTIAFHCAIFPQIDKHLRHSLQLSLMLPHSSRVYLLSLRRVLLLGLMRRLDVDVLRLWGQNWMDRLTTPDDWLDQCLLCWHRVSLFSFVNLWQVIQLSSQLRRWFWVIIIFYSN